LNDTIIIFDRVRENLRKFRRQNLVRDPESLDQRDAAALRADHGTTMARRSRWCCWRRGAAAFALVLTFAIFTGTFSSIYIAARC